MESEVSSYPLVQAGLNSESIFTPSLPSFKIVSLIEGDMQAGALDCKESCSPDPAAQRVAANDGDVDWCFPGHAKQPWEAAASQAGLEAGLCFLGAEALTFTQSQVCRHPMRSPCERPVGKCAAPQALECK